MTVRPPRSNPVLTTGTRIIRRMLAHLFPSHFGNATPRGVQLCDFGGVKVQLDFATAAHVGMYRSGAFEPELTQVISRLARRDDVFVDIGANVGWHTLSLLTRRPDVARSYAFEPSKRTFDMLVAGIEANDLTGRCRARNIALSNAPGRASFKTFPEFGSTHSSLYALADWPYVEEDVELDTLDNVAHSFDAAPAIIKCDVEGGERDVLLGATGVLSGRFGPPPIWLLEANYESAGMAGYFPYDLIDIAAKHAPYEPFSIREGRIVPLRKRAALRHGDTLVLAIPAQHADRLAPTSGAK